MHKCVFNPVHLVTSLSAERFFDEYRGRRPLVIQHQIAHWPASRVWSTEYLKREYGHAAVTVRLYDPQDSGLTFVDQTLAHVHKRMSLRDYLSDLKTADYRYAIREDTGLFKQYPQLLTELGYFSPFCSSWHVSDGHYKSIWIGPRDYVTGLHTDPGDTLLFQLWGKKQVLLFGPDQSRFLYEEDPEQLLRKFDCGNLKSQIDMSEFAVLRDKVKWCQIDPFHPDTQRFPFFGQAQGVEAWIGVGDTLYIPDGWWHAVRSLDVALSVSIEPDFKGPFFAR